MSGMFWRMILILSWCWGVGLLVAAIATTVLVVLLPHTIAFGVGLVVPFLCYVVIAMATTVFVKWSLKREGALEE
jgi:hypothetical protein